MYKVAARTRSPRTSPSQKGAACVPYGMVEGALTISSSTWGTYSGSAVIILRCVVPLAAWGAASKGAGEGTAPYGTWQRRAWGDGAARRATMGPQRKLAWHGRDGGRWPPAWARRRALVSWPQRPRHRSTPSFLRGLPPQPHTTCSIREYQLASRPFSPHSPACRPRARKQQVRPWSGHALQKQARAHCVPQRS